MKKPTLQQRLRYKFDNLMSKGTMSLLLILGIITAIVVVTGVTLVGIFITSQRLSQMMRATDFVVSSRITAKMMAQIAEERHKKAILNDMLSEGGASISMKPVTRYVMTGEPVDFYTLGASAARYGEIAIGYKKIAEDGSFTIEVNPRSRAATKFSDHDDLIVVAV